MLILNYTACVPVLMAVGMFSLYHFYCLVMNTTTIEGWEKDKAVTLKRKGKILEVSCWTLLISRLSLITSALSSATPTTSASSPTSNPSSAGTLSSGAGLGNELQETASTTLSERAWVSSLILRREGDGTRQSSRIMTRMRSRARSGVVAKRRMRERRRGWCSEPMGTSSELCSAVEADQPPSL